MAATRGRDWLLSVVVDAPLSDDYPDLPEAEVDRIIQAFISKFANEDKPPRECWRHIRLSHAAMLDFSIVA